MEIFLVVFIFYVMYVTIKGDVAKHKDKKMLKKARKLKERNDLAHLFEDDNK